MSLNLWQFYRHHNRCRSALDRQPPWGDLNLRPTIEGRRKLYLDVGVADAFVLHRGDNLFPLREREPVRIIDADPENDHIELEIQSRRLGRGRIDFYGAAPTADDFERWLDEVFELATPEADFRRYIGNRRSRTLHIRGANHLPPLADRDLFPVEDDALGRVLPRLVLKYTLRAAHLELGGAEQEVRRGGKP